MSKWKQIQVTNKLQGTSYKLQIQVTLTDIIDTKSARLWFMLLKLSLDLQTSFIIYWNSDLKTGNHFIWKRKKWIWFLFQFRLFAIYSFIKIFSPPFKMSLVDQKLHFSFVQKVVLVLLLILFFLSLFSEWKPKVKWNIWVIGHLSIQVQAFFTQTTPTKRKRPTPPAPSS